MAKIDRYYLKKTPINCFDVSIFFFTDSFRVEKLPSSNENFIDQKIGAVNIQPDLLDLNQKYKKTYFLKS